MEAREKREAAFRAIEAASEAQREIERYMGELAALKRLAAGDEPSLPSGGVRA